MSTRKTAWFRLGLVLAWLSICQFSLAATGTVTPVTYPGGNTIQQNIPISLTSDWVTACSDVTSTTDNATATVVNPSSITRSAQNWVQMTGRGTTLQIRLKYPTAASVSTSPVVQPFGRDGNLVPERLVDTSSTHAQTLTVDTTNDARETVGNFSFTQPVEVDWNGNKEVLIAVKTALAGTGLTGAAILVRVK